MSEEIEKLEEQLENATAPGDKLDDALDAETKLLREGWLALGELIEASQPSSADPPQLQYPTQPTPIQVRKPVGPKALDVLAVLAASLLIAALVTWSLVGGQKDQQIAKDQPNEAQPPSLIENAPIEHVAAPELVEDEQKAGDSAADALDWDAPLDTQIAAAGQEMLRIQADWYASDDTSSAIYYRMQQMRQDLNDNTL